MSASAKFKGSSLPSKSISRDLLFSNFAQASQASSCEYPSLRALIINSLKYGTCSQLKKLEPAFLSGAKVGLMALISWLSKVSFCIIVNFKELIIFSNGNNISYFAGVVNHKNDKNIFFCQKKRPRFAKPLKIKANQRLLLINQHNLHPAVLFTPGRRRIRGNRVGRAVSGRHNPAGRHALKLQKISHGVGAALR